MVTDRKHTLVSASVSQDSEAFGSVFERTTAFWPTGVAVLVTRDDGGTPAMTTVSSVVPVSIAPPLVSVCLRQEAPALEQLAPGAACTLYVLEQDGAAIAKAPATATLEVAPGGPLASLSGCVQATMPAGDHAIVLVDVREAAARPGRPLVYWRRAFWTLDVRHPFMESAATLDAFVDDWHRGRLPASAWTHGAHIATCAYYAFDRDVDETFATMKRGILAFAASVGVVHTPTSGYHETLTRLWSLVIGAHLAEHPAASRWDAAQSALEHFGDDRDLHRLFYSFDLLRDPHSRAEWVAPDRPLPNWLAQVI